MQLPACRDDRQQLVKSKVDKCAKICKLYFQMIAAASHCLAAKLRGGRREESHGQVGRWSQRESLVCNALIMQSLGILTVIKPNLWARKLFQQAKNSLSETWERCFNKTHKNSPINQKIENNSSSEDESFSDSGFSDLSSDGELLETESESCIQTKSKITRIQQKKNSSRLKMIF